MIKHDKPRIGNQENRAPIREAVVFQRRQTVGISRYPRGDPGGKNRHLLWWILPFNRFKAKVTYFHICSYVHICSHMFIFLNADINGICCCLAVASKKWPFCQDSSWKSLHRSHRDRWSNLSLCECVFGSSQVHPHSDRQIVRWFCFQKNGPQRDVGMSTNLTKSNKHISRWIVHNWDKRYSIHHSDALVTRDGDETAQWTKWSQQQQLMTHWSLTIWCFCGRSWSWSTNKSNSQIKIEHELTRF